MKFDQIPSKSVVEGVMSALSQKGYVVHSAQSSTQAMDMIKKLIPVGSSVVNGASTTLHQIGYIDYLKANSHGWRNLQEEILSEKDPLIQGRKRKEASVADYYLGSVHALMENGEFLIASNTASQIPSVSHNATNLIFVVGLQKIVKDMSQAFERLESYVLPLESQRSQKVYGVPSAINKVLIFKGENAFMGRTIHFILVEEALGF